jgi:hypothetical protein
MISSRLRVLLRIQSMRSWSLPLSPLPKASSSNAYSASSFIPLALMNFEVEGLLKHGLITKQEDLWQLD